MAVVLYRLLVIAGDLSFRVGKIAERSEEEIFATSSAVRHAANQAGNLMEKIVDVVDKYMYAQVAKQPAGGSPKTSQLMTGLTVGLSIFRFLTQMFKNRKKPEQNSEDQ